MDMTMTTQPQVTVYGAETCRQCWATERAMTRAGVAFDRVEVDKDEDVAAWLRTEGWKALPVVTVDGGPSWAGFRPDLIATIR